MKNILAAITLVVVLMVGTTFAGTGLLMSDLTGDQTPQPCSESTASDGTGIIVVGFTGIIVVGFTGIIVVGATEAPTDCGIIVVG